jgi:hypothetical protein
VSLALVFVSSLAIVLVNASAAYAGAPSDPPGGATPVYPQWNNGVVNQDRDSGADTTFYLMQTIGDLYTSAGLYGCTLNTGTGQTLYNSGFTSSSSNAGFYCQSDANTSTSDTSDNWDRTEIDQGVDLVGSNTGVKQLCAQETSPLPVNFARSSRPVDSPASPVGPTTPACSAETEVGFAKDAVPVVDLQTLNPSTFGTSTQTSATDDYKSINAGSVGPVADGWLPTDPVGGPYHGTAFSDVSDADNGGTSNSTAFRLWCASGTSQINDWGELTNLGPTLAVVNASVSSGSLTAAPEASLDGAFTGSTSPVTFPANVTGATVSGTGVPANTTVTAGAGTSSLTLSDSSLSLSNENLTFALANGESKLAVGQGLPDGIPVRIQGLSTSAGTETTLELFANSGSATGCLSNADQNAAGDPNPSSGGGATSSTNQHVAPTANNTSQIATFAESDFPGDAVDQAIEASTTIYYESNGVYNTDPFAGESQLWSSGTVGSGTASLFTWSKVTENEESTTTPNLLSNKYPTARTLFNMYASNAVTASTAGFLNWLCETTGDNSEITKGTDETNGQNYDVELTTIIATEYGFPRLTDESAVPSGGGTPADLQPAPNTTCASGLNSGSTAGNGEPPVTSIVNQNG